jgi:predicted DNA-binding antitoxin AbrB/MazE fold protein
MSHVEAIYRHGVFEPLEPVHLAEEQRVTLNIEPVAISSAQSWLARIQLLQSTVMERNGILPDSAPDIAMDRRR